MNYESTSQSVQDYLKHIYNLTQNDEPANTNSLAKRMGLKPGSVSEMLARLAEAQPPLVKYIKYQGATLTEDGKKAALRVIRRHRLIETFLVTNLGYGWDSIHEEACRLEHVVSDEFEIRIAEAMGHPSYSPHGEPIPTDDLSMPPAYRSTLVGATVGAKARVLQVPDSDGSLLRYLSEIGLVPGSQLVIHARSSFDGNLTLSVSPNPIQITLGPSITSRIFIQSLELT